MRAPAASAPLALCLAILVSTLAGSGCGESSSTASAAQGTSAPLVDWPLFGRIPERTHYLPMEGRDIDPPLRESWSIDTHALIEFPPAVAHGVAYVVNKYGNARAVRLADHRTLWERATDRRDRGNPTDVTDPVYHRGLVFFAFLDGRLVALDANSGRKVWERNLHAHLESSPLAVDGRLYLGDDKTNVVALRASDGRLLWQYNSPAAIKASPSFHRGRIYVADYEGAMFCLDARSGRLRWRTNTTRVAPYGEGGFYSSPAIAFGHVYAARDDGTIFAFDQSGGRVAWSFPTHNFVYGSPAVARVPGTRPSVYIGSYDKHFYALDAFTGRQEWRYDVGGPVPGTATVIGHTAYTSTFKTQEAIGIDVRTHRKTFDLHNAGYTPAVSDGRNLYLVGYFDLVGLEPKR